MTRVALYRLYDAAGTLLYVGISANPEQRWKVHSWTKAKPWWPDVARKTVEWHDSPESAALAEHIAIATESPKFNTERLRGATAVPIEVGDRVRNLIHRNRDEILNGTATVVGHLWRCGTACLWVRRDDGRLTWWSAKKTRLAVSALQKPRERAKFLRLLHPGSRDPADA